MCPKLLKAIQYKEKIREIVAVFRKSLKPSRII